MESARPILETHGLTKNYGRLAALKDCTLSVQQGEVFGLLGPNGSGKTTLLRLLMGFLRPTRGQSAIAGRDCFRDSVAVHAVVSYLPGDVRLFRGMKGRDVLAFFARLRGQRQPLAGIQLAERLGLDLSRKVAQMSTGMRQKLALAAVLAVDAPLLILDEPTSNLDPTVRSTVLSLIGEARAAGRSVLFSSHVLSEIERIADRVAILRRGRLAHQQVMSEIRRRHRIRARLTGALPPLPELLTGQLTLSRESENRVSIVVPGDLSPMFGWLATLPLAEVHIEPLGLQAVYEQFHPAEVAA
jgi:ABC-2 type transport system ATP-binding protein